MSTRTPQPPGEAPAVAAILREAQNGGLIGPTPIPEQMAHAMGFADAAEGFRQPGSGTDWPGSWLDLGAGGGLPGLVLAQRWGFAHAVLLDAAEKRVRFLARAVERLGWQRRVEVVRARAEDEGRRRRAELDLVVARSFASPAVTAECAAPFLRIGGLLVVSEPPSPSPVPGERGAEAARWPEGALSVLGLQPVMLWRSQFRYQVLRQVSACPDRFPRRVGVASKRPLYRFVEG